MGNWYQMTQESVEAGRPYASANTGGFVTCSVSDAAGPFKAKMVKVLLKAKKSKPEAAPEGEKEFMDWLNAL